MTAVPLPRFPRRQPKPRNHGAYNCPTCQAPPFADHTGDCARPTADGNAYRGVLIGLPLGVAGWLLAAALFIALIRS
ncbi:hypothetical protein [Micromonospora sp. C41]|uniref:hypothetical protein n=1 Tax=Micromonospora sp. C41 TaxID=2824878 RepID=UPI001B35BF04|nr:hypothetical protein [Micromonospora sp. C41]MBQ1064511.1 hypothetical protein [Micromonospora sp. C41]